MPIKANNPPTLKAWMKLGLWWPKTGSRFTLVEQKNNIEYSQFVAECKSLYLYDGVRKTWLAETELAASGLQIQNPRTGGEILVLLVADPR